MYSFQGRSACVAILTFIAVCPLDEVFVLLQDVPEVKDDQPQNTHVELQVFQAHTDIVRLLVRIDSSR